MRIKFRERAWGAGLQAYGQASPPILLPLVNIRLIIHGNSEHPSTMIRENTPDS